MAYRGSLKKCILMMGYQFQAGNYPRLSIVNNTHSKYYTLCTDDELKKVYNDINALHYRLVATLTPKELSQFTVQAQTALELEVPPGD